MSKYSTNQSAVDKKSSRCKDCASYVKAAKTVFTGGKTQRSRVLGETSRKCTHCDEGKLLTEYPIAKQTKDGRGSICKDCISKKARQKRNRFPTEHAECVGFLNWFKSSFQGVLIFHVPNGMKRDILSAKLLKEAGVVKGIPDYFIPKWNVWLEMKRQHGGSLGPEQKLIHEYLRDQCNHTVIVGKGAKDASRQVLEWVKLKRA